MKTEVTLRLLDIVKTEVIPRLLYKKIEVTPRLLDIVMQIGQARLQADAPLQDIVYLLEAI